MIFGAALASSADSSAKEMANKEGMISDV